MRARRSLWCHRNLYSVCVIPFNSQSGKTKVSHSRFKMWPCQVIMTTKLHFMYFIWKTNGELPLMHYDCHHMWYHKSLWTHVSTIDVKSLPTIICSCRSAQNGDLFGQVVLMKTQKNKQPSKIKKTDLRVGRTTQQSWQVSQELLKVKI